jgi:hypothetical protein
MATIAMTPHCRPRGSRRVLTVEEEYKRGTLPTREPRRGYLMGPGKKCFAQVSISVVATAMRDGQRRGLIASHCLSRSPRAASSAFITPPPQMDRELDRGFGGSGLEALGDRPDERFDIAPHPRRLLGNFSRSATYETIAIKSERTGSPVSASSCAGTHTPA